MNRLIAIEALDPSQIKALRYLHNSAGHCACGRELSNLSAKFVFCNAVTQNPLDKRKHESLIMGAYCWACAQEINAVLHRLRKTVEVPNGRH